MLIVLNGQNVSVAPTLPQSDLLLVDCAFIRSNQHQFPKENFGSSRRQDPVTPFSARSPHRRNLSSCHTVSTERDLFVQGINVMLEWVMNKCFPGVPICMRDKWITHRISSAHFAQNGPNIATSTYVNGGVRFTKRSSFARRPSHVGVCTSHKLKWLNVFLMYRWPPKILVVGFRLTSLHVSPFHETIELSLSSCCTVSARWSDALLPAPG